MPWKSTEADWWLRFVRETSAATWTVGQNGYVFDVPEWLALTGQTQREAEGDGWMNALHPDDVERVRAAWNTAVAHGTPYNTDYRLRCADGIYRWFNARGTLITDRDGAGQRWVGVILAIPGHARLAPPSDAVRTANAARFEDITAGALRAARAILQWPADKMAEEAGISRSTLRRLEDDQPVGTPRRASVAKIIQVLASHQLEFVGRGEVITGVIDPSSVRARDPGEGVSALRAPTSRLLQ